MKLFSVVLICYFNTTSDLFSQTLASVGMKSGMSISSQTWSNTIMKNPDHEIGINIALFAEMTKHKHFSIMPEIGFTQKGYETLVETTTEEHPEGTGHFFDIGHKYDYLYLTISAKARYDFRVLTPYVYLGPRLDYLVRKDISEAGVSGDLNPKKTGFGLTSGIGVETDALFPFPILAEIQYSPDFTRVYSGTPIKMKNYSMQICVGAKMVLK